MVYSMDMGAEKAPVRRKLLPEGWREFIISSCEPSVSKGGNDMFVFKMIDKETNYEDTVYLIAVPGKRWMLKSLLSCCGVSASQDGKYDWDIKDVLRKVIMGLVEHEPNDYINRNGETVKGFQHKIVEFKECEEQEWDKDLK